jgi:hypothetical protein
VRSPSSRDRGARGLLREGHVATRIPARDLQRARRFYAEKLGLQPSAERPGGLLYRCASGEFAVFESAVASSGSFTQLAWQVEDIEAQGEPRACGVVSRQRGKPAGNRPSGSVNGIYAHAATNCARAVRLPGLTQASA